MFLHPNPTSCYQWRNIVPHLSGQAHSIAPGLTGIGRSDKPDINYRFFHDIRYIEGFIKALAPRELAFVVRDSGLALGFYYPIRRESKVRGSAFMEPVMAAVLTGDDFPAEFRTGFQAFHTPDAGWEILVSDSAFVEKVLPRSIIRPVTDKELDHCRSLYREPASRKPLSRWPNEPPIAGRPEDVVRAVSAYNAKLLFHAEPGTLAKKLTVDCCKAHLPNLETVDLGGDLFVAAAGGSQQNDSRPSQQTGRQLWAPNNGF